MANDSADVLSSGRSFHACWPATGKARLPTVDSLLIGTTRQDHVTPLLRDNLHWLRVRERILFKLCSMVYRALSGLAPSYITELCVPVASIHPRSSLLMAHCSSRALVWNSTSARSPSPPQLLGTVSLATSGARQHLTNLNSA